MVDLFIDFLCKGRVSPGLRSNGKIPLVLLYVINYVQVFDNYAVTVPVKDQLVTLNLMDTAGQEDYDRLRPLTYTNVSIFLVCFSLASRNSLENVTEKWVPELRKYAPGVPYILVGTQSDRRQPGDRHSVSQAEGLQAAKDIGAVEYAECSAKTRDGLKDVFNGAIITAINKNGNGKRKTRTVGEASGSTESKGKVYGVDESDFVQEKKKSRCSII